MAAHPGRGAPADTAAVPLADGRADDCTEEICQAGGTAGIYGMTIVQNREIFPLPCRRKNTLYGCTQPSAEAFRYDSGGITDISALFLNFADQPMYKSHIRRQEHRHYDGCRMKEDSQKALISAIMKPYRNQGAEAWL